MGDAGDKPADELEPVPPADYAVMAAYDALPPELRTALGRYDSQICPACVERELDKWGATPLVVSRLLAHMNELDRQWSAMMNRAALR